MKPVKIILAMLLLAALLKLPYGYYVFLRFIGAVGFAVLTYLAYKINHRYEAVLYTVSFFLLQPVYMFTLSRFVWNIVDASLGVWLIVSAIMIKPVKKIDRPN